MVRLTLVLDSFKEGIAFLKKEWRSLLKQMVRIDLIAFFAIALLVTIGAGVLYLGSTNFVETKNWTAMAFGLAGLVFFGGIGLIAGAAIHSSTYNLVEARIENKTFEIKNNAFRNLLPTIFWLVFWTIFIALAFSPYILYVWKVGESGIDPAGLNFTQRTSLNAMGNFAEGISQIVLTIISFFLVFALFELLVARKGFFKSMGSSVALVKGKFWETLAFQIGTTIVSTFLGLVLMIPLAVFIILLAVIAVPGAGLAKSSPVIGVLLIVLLVAIITAGLAVVSGITSTITKPLIYYFWKAVRQPDEETLKTRTKKK